MPHKSFFSIIIPVFNTEKYLNHCLESVLSQSNQDFEIIVINDCSPGTCVDIINGYNDNRIKVIDKKANEGTHMARKTGVELANSKYCLFLDSDDCFAVNCLELLYTNLKENPVVNKQFGTCSLEYYYNAIDYFKDKVEKPVFFIFSDDICWVKENLKISNDIYFHQDEYNFEDYEEMHLMTLCKHNIIANSSFSWWGAWLNNNEEKIVIAPKKWFIDESLHNKDLIPKEWIRL